RNDREPVENQDQLQSRPRGMGSWLLFSGQPRVGGRGIDPSSALRKRSRREERSQGSKGFGAFLRAQDYSDIYPQGGAYARNRNLLLAVKAIRTATFCPPHTLSDAEPGRTHHPPVGASGLQHVSP